MKNNISNSFNETLKDSDLQNIGGNLSELILDSVLEDGVLKDIPIVSSIVGLTNIGIKISDRVLLNKIISFLFELKNIPSEKREEMINKIDNSKKHKIKVGEKLLLIIDKCNDYENSQYTAKLFSSYLAEKINYEDFLRGANIIQSVEINDFKNFLNLDKNKIVYNHRTHENLKYNDVKYLMHVGLFETNTEEISVRAQDDWKMADQPYVVEGGELTYDITELGRMLYDVLN
ncbi:hypothetical protein [Wenyingzhuangia aestuarii]|uniref:hypothetical protein n=1 Tax=Wenyingzhuangia aestuarii TaxID=1647582 RepID=UPI001439B5C9|nr:hypothetical protein [Wenyingzhuangia aestuarii]NJB84208.1 flagellar biosynthesis chaperone FliJ [Wenyingzhuangia aestuarii]